MNAKQRIESKQTTFILLVGDSLTGEENYKYPQKICELLAAKYPDANVLLEKRAVDQSYPCPVNSTIIQSGNGGYSIKVIIDGVPGSNSLQATSAARMAHIFCEPPHLTSIFLGTNDAIQGYPCGDYIGNLTYIGNTAKQTYRSDVCLITPAWSESSLCATVGGYARACALAARKAGFAWVDARKIFEDNYQAGNGYFGQKTWFSDPNDHTHFNGGGHAALAAEWMRVNGF